MGETDIVSNRLQVLYDLYTYKRERETMKLQRENEIELKRCVSARAECGNQMNLKTNKAEHKMTQKTIPTFDKKKNSRTNHTT